MLSPDDLVSTRIRTCKVEPPDRTLLVPQLTKIRTFRCSRVQDMKARVGEKPTGSGGLLKMGGGSGKKKKKEDNVERTPAQVREQ